MTDDEHLPEPHRGPILLCAGTDAIAAARLAEVAACLLADRPAVVLTACEPSLPQGDLDAVRDALHDTHADLRAANAHVQVDAARAARDVLEAHGLQVTTRVCPDERSPWRVILEHGDKIDAAVIVAGTSQPSMPHPGSLGSQARALAHRARRPLLLLPVDGTAPTGADTPAIFAYDGSVPAGHAIGTAAALLRPRPAIVANVWQSAFYAVGLALLAVPDEVARKGAEALDKTSRQQAEGHASAGAALLAAAGWSCETAALDARSVPGAIIGAADEHGAAIVVTGTRGRSRIASALLGSSAEGILRHADRPVLLVPPAAA